MRYYHNYKCVACNQDATLLTNSVLNPLKGRLSTHGSAMNSTLREDNPYMQGLNILEAIGTKSASCAGGLKYLGISSIPPAGSKIEKETLSKVQLDAKAVYSDMKRQYDLWDGSTKHRGAWWGSSRPGYRGGSKSVPQNVILEIKKLVIGSKWAFQNSFTGGLSFHRKKDGSVDFIYHMKS